MIARALDGEDVRWSGEGQPMRASEDFGRFAARAPSAMFLLGAGERHASLHNANYDFPDGLIGVAARVMMRVARDALRLRRAVQSAARLRPHDQDALEA